MVKKKSILIGLGNIGLNYDLNTQYIMTHAKSLLKNKNVKFICGIDKSINQRKIFNKRYKIPSFAKLNNKALLDSNFIVLSTPNHTHLKYIQKILLYKNIKTILLEKPGGSNFNDFKYIKYLCKKRGVKLYINYQRLYDKNYLKIKNTFNRMTNFKGVVNYSRGLENNCGHVLSLFEKFNLKKTKILLLNKKENPDFFIKFSKGQILFLNNPRKNISNNEFELVSRNYKIKSFNEMNKFYIFKIQKDKYIKKNHVFSNKSNIIEFDQKNSQKSVLDVILRGNKTLYKDILENSYNTFKLINKIRFMVKNN